MTAAEPRTGAPAAAAALGRAAHRVERRIEEIVRPPAGPGLDGWRVLDLLADGEGHPMSEIAAYAMVPAPTLTKIVDRLVDRGLVHRRPDDADRRRVLVFGTDRGRELHAALRPRVAEIELEVLGALGADAGTVLAALSRLG
ncbi:MULTISPECIES: MarR family winged helix-turn-helix transcriptional regulator [Pseudonocardia]|uniref:MarR family protein n=1 Tax=Pseudonocardia autotrophica TaxID=2074 RepID=A0A1Y2N626_PSEAH|nr:MULTISPECIES: MarR family transcriptional regulator [Pseudonocardia]OSY42920.1 MarR family protein [Pseudonocardia autotrophica]TDN77497.1 DNA-binding MarR family transcriptional regulator [Pseudonocardia autotrophica]